MRALEYWCFQVLIHTSVSVVITFNPQLVFAYLFTSTRKLIFLNSINCYSIALSTPGFLLDLRHTESESFVSPFLMIFLTFSQENLTLWFGCILKRMPVKRNASLPPISFKPPRASSLQQNTTGMTFEPCSDKRIPLSPIGREEVWFEFYPDVRSLVHCVGSGYPKFMYYIRNNCVAKAELSH